MSGADEEKRIGFTKVVEEKNVPTGVPANSPRYHQNHPSVLVEKDSSPSVWSHDPVDDQAAMDHLQKGIAALFSTCETALPDPIEAEGHFLEALKLHQDFTRAWVNLSIALVSQQKLIEARQVLEMLIRKGEAEKAWPMTSGVRAKIHHNLGQVYYRLHLEGSSKDNQLVKLALNEYKKADELDGFVNSAGLLPMLVAQVDLGLTDEQTETVKRIQDFVKTHGADAKELVTEYNAKYVQLAHVKLIPNAPQNGAENK